MPRRALPGIGILLLLAGGLASVSSSRYREASRTEGLSPGHAGVMQNLSTPRDSPQAPESGSEIALYGFVLDAQGHPVCGAKVVALDIGQGGNRCCRRTGPLVGVFTNEEGRFELTSSRPSTGLVASFSTSGEVSKVVSSSGPHYLTFPPAGRIAGVVLDEQGRAIPQAEIIARIRSAGASISELRSSLRLRTEPNGQFDFPEVAAGTLVVLEVRADGYQPSRSRPLRILEAGTSWVELVLRQGNTLTGRVLAANGSPLEGVHLEATQGAGFTFQTVSESDGSFLLEGLSHEAVRLTARAEGYAPQTLRRPHPSEVGDLHLNRETILHGRILPPREGLYAVLVSEGARYRSPIAPDGRFELPASATEIQINIETVEREIVTSRKLDLSYDGGEVQIPLP